MRDWKATAALVVALVATTGARRDDSVEAKFAPAIRQSPNGFVKAGEGYVSAAGQQIASHAQPLDSPCSQIYTRLPASGRPKGISTGRGRTTCSYFSTDGKRSLF